MPYKDPEKQKQAQHASYLKRKDKLLEHGREYKKSRREYIRQSKLGKACFDCGIIYPYYVMDYDHRDPNTKVTNLARMPRCSLETIQKEIDKCDLVCSNCHRMRTHNVLDE